MVHKSLIYIGADYDYGFPWGGYHITITGRNPHPIPSLLSFLQSPQCTTDMFETFDGSIGWKLTHDKIKHFELDESAGSILVFIACERLDRFHEVLQEFSATSTIPTTNEVSTTDDISHSIINPPLQGLKQNWHITMQTKDVEAAKTQVQQWIDEDKVFRLFAVDWNSESSTTVWYQVDKC